MAKTCPKCSTENRDQARHCSSCGSPMSVSDSGGVRYCPSGRHPMDPGWEVCPYCASEAAAGPKDVDVGATLPDSPDLPPPPGGGGRKKTVIDPLAGVAPQREPSGGSGPRGTGDRKKTRFKTPEPATGSVPEPGARRIVAVLVTYTWRPEGQLFPVYEARNYVGSDGDCEICLDLDDQISARHATIIYRGNDFWINDKESLNGTYVNGESVEERQRLPNGARIQTGATVWKFVSLEPPP